jgi:hypothetical protein
MELHKYDYILIFVGNIEENDLEIAKKLRGLQIANCIDKRRLPYSRFTSDCQFHWFIFPVF